MAPTPPNARSAPGEPVALLDLALIEGGGPEMAPTPPDARDAPGNPWRSSISREQPAGEQGPKAGQDQRGVAKIVGTRLVARNRDASHPRGPRRAHTPPRGLPPHPR